MSGESLGVGELGFGVRLAEDAALRALVGVDENDETRIYHGYPVDLLEQDEPVESEFPRVTYFRAGGLKAAKGSGDLRIQVNIWVPYGEKEALEAIDSRIIDLIDEKWWIYDGRRLSGRAIGGESDTPARRRRPGNRRRDYWIGVG